MSQSVKRSFLESLSNTSTGLVVNWFIVYLIAKYSPYGPAVTTTIITVTCTVHSLIRSFSYRRLFNKGD